MAMINAIVYVSCDDDKTVRIRFDLGERILPAMPEECEFTINECIFDVAHYSYNADFNTFTIHLKDECWLDYDSDQLIEEFEEAEYVASIGVVDEDDGEEDEEEEGATAIAKPAHAR